MAKKSDDTEKVNKTDKTEIPNPNLTDIIASQTVEDIEKLQENLRYATVASSKIAEAVTGFGTEYINKHPKLDPLGLAPYTAEVTTRLANSPEKVLEAQQKLWAGYAGIWTEMVKSMIDNTSPNSEKPDMPPVKDKRFSNPEWQSNIMFDMLRRTYLHTSQWFTDLIESAEGVDDLTRRKASFFTQQMANAFSPSNFLLTNPVALKEMFVSRGESVSRGMVNMLQDIQKGNGRLALSQTDLSAFEVGRNVATTPGKVVYRGKLFELIQYTPTTEQVYEIPLLIFPPWINKFYIMDLREDNSLIRWLVSKGYTVFVVSWINPTQELSDYGFEEYIEQGVFEAIEQVQKVDNIKKVNCVGYCIGGTLLATTMAYMAKIGDKRINSATFFASQQDFEEAGDLKIFTDDAAYQFISDEIEHAGGVLDSSIMADTFNYLRSNDLVYSFVINNYLMGKDPKPFDLLFWNSDQTRMPKTLHLTYIDNYYRKNNFSKGLLTIKGENINLGDIKSPIYMQASKDDHIAPYRSVYRGAKLFGGDVRMILAGSGHIAGVINHPDANKYQHWLPEAGKKLPETVEEWQSGLTEHKGSWWNDWDSWLSKISGKLRPAREPGAGKLDVICDAPGTYVLMK